jgi:hypothetical protein
MTMNQAGKNQKSYKEKPSFRMASLVKFSKIFKEEITYLF